MKKEKYKEYQQLLKDKAKLKQELPVKLEKISNLQETFRHIDSYFSSRNPLDENPNIRPMEAINKIRKVEI